MADRVIVLAGGHGSRDVPYRTLVPKPLLPVGGRSVLELMLVELARHGFVDVTLAVGQLAPLIRALLGERAHAGLRIRYAQDHEPLGAGGALARMAPEDPFLVLDGSALTTLDLRRLWHAHEAKRNIVTIATHRRAVRHDFGALRLSDDGDAVCGYVEKAGATFDVSMGVYAMRPEVRQYLTPGERLGMPELINRLVSDGARVGAFPHSGLRLDMRRREDYELAQTRIDEIQRMFGVSPPIDTSVLAAASG